MIRQHLMRLAWLLLIAFPATATVVTLERGVAGEVCRFRGEGRENPLQRWFASDEVTCVAAGTDMEFPPGPWNVFGKAAGQVSREVVVVDGSLAPESLRLTLAPAATLTAQLPAEHHAVAYAPRRGIAVPVGQPVPAGEELWLLVVAKGVPVAIHPVPAIESGAIRNVDARGAGVSGILAWLQVPSVDQAALRSARDVSAPKVRATVVGPAIDSDPLPPLDLLHNALVLIRNVPAGDAEVDVGGRGWLSHRRRVKVGAANVTVLADALRVRGAASLIVRWNADWSTRDLERSLGSCNPMNDAPPQFEITVSSCPRPERPRQSVDPKSCQLVRRETFPPDLPFGTFAVDDIPPGLYLAELRFGKLPPVGTLVGAPPFVQREVPVSTDYFDIEGSVTYGGEPLGKDLAIQFPGSEGQSSPRVRGSPGHVEFPVTDVADDSLGGVGFAPAETGQYRAVLVDALDTDAQIQVTTCDGALRTIVLGEGPVRPRSRFDIDIPDNELVVRVTDTFTRLILRSATVSVVVMDKSRRYPVFARILKAESAAGARMRHVPERELRISVSLAGYQKQTLPPFTMPKSGVEVAEVQLVPLRGNSGKVLSLHPFERGMIFWFSVDGRQTESVELAPDGTFLYTRAHDLGETMAIVSLSHPLWVSRSPFIDFGATTPQPIRFPQAPARTFDVTLDELSPPKHIGLVIGGVRAPQPVLQLHQALRGTGALARGRAPLVIRDIAETGPIDVLLGPTPSSDTTGGFDFFALPHYANVPRQRLLPGSLSVVFE